MKTRLCKGCCKRLPLTAFGKSKCNKNKYYLTCMSCRRSRQRVYYGYPKDKIVRTLRVCLGVRCRGQKQFLAWPGERICKACKEMVRGIEDNTYKFQKG